MTNYTEEGIQTIKKKQDELTQQLERHQEALELKRKIEGLLEDQPFTIEELFGLNRSKGGRKKAVYQNPNDKRQTWSGVESKRYPEGKPGWVMDVFKSGGNIEDYRIEGR